MQPIEVFASYEATLGICSAGRPFGGNSHGEGSSHLPVARGPFGSGRVGVQRAAFSYGTQTNAVDEVTDCVQAIAALFLLAGHPELICHEMAQLLLMSGSIEAAHSVVKHEGQIIEQTEFFGDCGKVTGFQSIAVSDTVDLLVDAKTDVRSRAALNAIQFLLSAARDLGRAHPSRRNATPPGP